MAKDWSKLTAAELGRGIGAGKINAVELTEYYLDAIAAHPEAHRIYARTTPARARAEAMGAAARAKAGLRRGVLDGVPISWKDLYDTAGTVTEAGTALLRGRTPKSDAEVLRVASLEGTVCLGKTHMTELAFSGLGVNPVTATPPNINDDQAAPGGSSSGAAASIAFGLAPAAIGSDTGGSVRIPAAWNDLVGLKTTTGRLPLAGVVPLCERFDTVGPLARTVEDCALLLSAMEGAKPADLSNPTLSGKRLLVLETVALDDVRDAPAQAFASTLTRLAAAGTNITHAQIPQTAEAMQTAGPLFAAEAYGIWGKLIESAPEKMFPRILERFRTGAALSAAEFVANWRRLDALRLEWLAATAQYDAVLLPTSPIMPPNAKRLLTDEAYFVAENTLALRNTRIGNVLGLCVLTLPTGHPSCGLSVMMPPMQEARLLRLGAAMEPALR